MARRIISMNDNNKDDEVPDLDAFTVGPKDETDPPSGNNKTITSTSVKYYI